MDGQLFMAFEDNKIMSVALMVTEKQILAMDRIYFFPILKGKLDGRKRRMSMKLITEAMLLKEGKNLGNSLIFHYLAMLFAKWVGAAFFFSGCTILAGCFLT